MLAALDGGRRSAGSRRRTITSNKLLPFKGFWRATAASLTARVLLVGLLLIGALGIVGVLVFSKVVDLTRVRLGTGFAEHQVLYDRARGLGTLQRDMALAETNARSEALIRWLRDEGDTAKKRAAITELRRVAELSEGGTFFVGSAATRAYYYEEAGSGFLADRPRLTLQPGRDKDRWFFEALSRPRDCRLNVDSDDLAMRTRVFINCVVRDKGRALGVTGTAVDLSSFVREALADKQPGVSTFFVTHEGAVQAHRDRQMVQHNSGSNRPPRLTVFDMLAPEDRPVLAGMMQDVASGKAAARSSFLNMNGERVLVGVGYLDGLDWYNVTVMNADAMVDRSLFGPIAVLIILMLLLGGALAVALFKRVVLDPIRQLEISVVEAERGNFEPAEQLDLNRDDELGRLSRRFAAMARAVAGHTRSLEARVRERTIELEQLAYRDPATGVANRRGFVTAFEEVQRERGSATVALLLIDVDHFKQINDRFGHVAGDVVVAEIARRIQQALRPSDVCGRWGGDEFIVLLHGLAADRLETIAARLVDAVSAHPIQIGDGDLVSVRLSVGAYCVASTDTIDRATERADAAMYRAKEEGRDRIIFAGDRAPVA
ncbi:GGDEF domain-containing protein [Sphingomonas sp. 3-13AW]|uniref:GGDEF domain-containing protein n=1 Tax=Sphingomonas sp. 3-13AW TaxID=3050450 RepID=UPI003BB768B5